MLNLIVIFRLHQNVPTYTFMKVRSPWTIWVFILLSGSDTTFLFFPSKHAKCQARHLLQSFVSSRWCISRSKNASFFYRVIFGSEIIMTRDYLMQSETTQMESKISKLLRWNAQHRHKWCDQAALPNCLSHFLWDFQKAPRRFPVPPIGHFSVRKHKTNYTTSVPQLILNFLNTERKDYCSPTALPFLLD